MCIRDRCGGLTFFGDEPGDICGCNGEVLDNCGVCDNNPSNDCMQDCSGEWGGSSELDDCGDCNGNNEAMDCAGVCYGNSELDDCGECDDNPDNDNLTCTGCTNQSACNYGGADITIDDGCLLYTSPSPRDATLSRMPSSA